MINPVDRLSWQEMLGHPASAGHLVDTQVNTAYNKMAVLSDHIDEFKDLYDFVFRIKGWLKYYLQANYGLEDFSDIGLNNDTNGHSGSIDLINPATGEVKTKKVWRIYIKNYDEIIKASEAGTTIPDPIVRFANIYDPLNPVYLDLEYKNGKPTFSGTFNPDDTNSYIPLWYLNEQIAQLKRDFKITLVGDATGSGTMDDNVNVVVSTTVSHATNADHAASADKTTGGTVNITGYVSGTGTVDDDGNVTVRVLPDIGNRTYTYYVGKTNAKNWWGYDENGNEWGSTKDHPFASLVYAINQSNMHIFPGNSINICVLDAGEYDESYLGLSVKSSTYVYSTAGSHPVFRMSSDMNLDSDLIFNGIDFRIHRCSSRPANGQPFFRLFKIGSLIFRGACHMVADFDNFGGNWWPFIVLSGNTKVSFNYMEGKIPLFLEVTPGVTISGCFRFTETAGFGLCTTGDNSPDPAVACRINAPAGSKIAGCVVSVDRAGSVSMGETPYPEAHRLVFDWGIADQSSLVQVNLGKYSYLWLYKNPNAGQPLPGHDVGSVPDSADYVRNDL